jgi:penicillin-binding protein 1B
VKRALVFALVAVALLGSAWVVSLDRRIVREFEARRWSEPARVYAAPLELYAGQALTAAGLEAELRRLGYRKATGSPAPGTYERRGARVEFAARPVRFWDETRAARDIVVTFDARSVRSLAEARGGAVATFRLDPQLIGSFFAAHGEDRIVLTPEQVPGILQRTLKVVEDRDFDGHAGIDPSAIARALLANARARAIEQGGSTLTQQLVRSYFLDNRQTVARKLREALMALLLELHFDKREIMTAYANEVYLGQDGRRAVHGFGIASQFYFGKSLAELEPHEVATLVAIVRGPSYYDPRRHPDRARQRRDLVLKLMGEFAIVSREQARAAAARPLGLVDGGSQGSGYHPGFLDLVRRTLRRDYREADLTESGLRIFTTLEPRAQALAERTLTQELARLQKTQATAAKAPGGAAARLEGVAIVTAPQNGDVLALVGGRQTALQGFNRALDARRPIGSLAKPVVYLAALETGRFHAASIVQDTPVQLRLEDGEVWRPQNIDKQVNGPVPLVRALAQSMNLATVNLGLQVGVARVAKLLRTMGLEREPRAVPAILLGAVEATPIEVAQVYGTLANGGFLTPLRAVRAVVDARGTPLQAFELETRAVASPESVYEIDRMLVEVVNRGTGAAARARLSPELVVGGKSGTSSAYRDSWFAGFSGSHVAVVWVGRDDNQPTRLTGASGALTVWTGLMAGLETTSWNAPLPESLDEVWIDYATGNLADPECAADVLSVAVPREAQLPVLPNCAAAREGLGTRARHWLRRMIGR